ncbi:hypothetical protein FDC50_06905 [Clostridium botulinum]|uniref:hypothetical protein n=1 Tax=unclassified Clostridium TaxID=2614128 RepID=UPI000506C7AA|nr:MULTISPECIES: hypothetical protein [unclassified Clostridium]AIY81781.1 putative membrane protein [Clostridium botulinum 202F]KAI3346141.1 hypothetical protein CIT17_11255 [Clostridium botulinum]KFX55276.1 hypothetical protein KU40_08545 [Clostridium botulinum]KFX56066.1 hypothetical protein KU41_16910 [Clostridium botulinum]MBY6804252.1 hypothetical protein [Clostridium botulinum]
MITVNHKNLKIVFKQYIIDMLVMSGLFMWLKTIWDALEITFDNGVQESISDSVIAGILIFIVWIQIRKWVVIKESEVEQ